MQQDYQTDRYEIIVVDDGSTDETPVLVADIRSRTSSPKLRYVCPEGTGVNVSRNAGVRAAEGDPIVFVDDDVIAPPKWLMAISGGALRHPEVGCFGGPVRLQFEGKPLRLCSRDHSGETELDFGDSERIVDIVVGANMAIRRAAVEKVGLFNEALSGYGDESEWQFRLREAGGRIVYIPDAWVWHRRTALDLKLWRLLRKQFQRGAEHPRYAKLIGQRLSARRELGAIPRFMAHAIRRGCVGGLLSASVRAGRAWGLAQERSSHALKSFKSVVAKVLSWATFEQL